MRAGARSGAQEGQNGAPGMRQSFSSKTNSQAHSLHETTSSGFGKGVRSRGSGGRGGSGGGGATAITKLLCGSCDVSDRGVDLLLELVGGDGALLFFV